jgi:hypothetical protein
VVDLISSIKTVIVRYGSDRVIKDIKACESPGRSDPEYWQRILPLIEERTIYCNSSKKEEENRFIALIIEK